MSTSLRIYFAPPPFIIHPRRVCFKYNPRHSGRTDGRTERCIRLWIFALLLTLYLTPSSSHFRASSPSRLRQHFCPSMNIWMRLNLPIRARTRAYTLPVSPFSSHKHFIDSSSSQVRQSADFLNFRRGWILDGREMFRFFCNSEVCEKVKRWKQRNRARDEVRPAVEGHTVWLFALNQPAAATSTSK